MMAFRCRRKMDAGSGLGPKVLAVLNVYFLLAES
jgi:hypothetical protein